MEGEREAEKIKRKIAEKPMWESATCYAAQEVKKAASDFVAVLVCLVAIWIWNQIDSLHSNSCFALMNIEGSLAYFTNASIGSQLYIACNNRSNYVNACVCVYLYRYIYYMVNSEVGIRM